MGLTPARALQTDDLDPRTRNTLWNAFHAVYLFDAKQSRMWYDEDILDALMFLWGRCLRKAAHTFPNSFEDVDRTFYAAFADAPWYEVMNLAEEVANLHEPFAHELNDLFEREAVAFRRIGRTIVPLSSDAEAREVERARGACVGPLGTARVHLDAALSKLGERPAPDIRNAIKEAICAVEVVARRIAGEGNTLGEALKASDVEMNGALKSGFEKLYGWTNGPDGIRHALMDDPKLGVEDARFMVVTCSAFVNYLIVKADRAGLRLER
jgi:AbiJ N-terminal domain 4